MRSSQYSPDHDTTASCPLILWILMRRSVSVTSDWSHSGGTAFHRQRPGTAPAPQEGGGTRSAGGVGERGAWLGWYLTQNLFFIEPAPTFISDSAKRNLASSCQATRGEVWFHTEWSCQGIHSIKWQWALLPLVTLNSQIPCFSSWLYRLHMVAELYLLMRLLVLHPFSKFSR